MTIIPQNTPENYAYDRWLYKQWELEDEIMMKIKSKQASTATNKTTKKKADLIDLGKKMFGGPNHVMKPILF